MRESDVLQPKALERHFKTERGGVEDFQVRFPGLSEQGMTIGYWGALGPCRSSQRPCAEPGRTRKLGEDQDRLIILCILWRRNAVAFPRRATQQNIQS